MNDPLMSPAEFHDHQRRALRQIEMYENRKTVYFNTNHQQEGCPNRHREQAIRNGIAIHENLEKQRQNIEAVKDDPSPHVEILRAIPWAIGAFLAVIVFVGLAFWAYVEWQPKLDLSYKGPAHYSRSGK